jgi:signal transduction histidine kinase
VKSPRDAQTTRRHNSPPSRRTVAYQPCLSLFEALNHGNSTARSLDQRTLAETIFLHVSSGVLICNAKGKIVFANSPARHMAQMDPEGQSLRQVAHIWGELFDLSGNRVAVRDWPCQKALRGQRTMAKEYYLSHPGGSSYLLFSSAPVRNMGGQLVGAVSILTDVTHSRQRELLQREEAVWKERSCIAADIHDNVSQGLTAIVLQLKAGENAAPENLDLALEHFRQARNVAEESLTETRRSIWMLGLEANDKQDPAVALSFFAKQLFAGLPVKLNLALQEKGGNLPSEIRAELVRIGREALTNIVKHAHATEVTVTCRYKSREVQLQVADNGEGFSPRDGFSADGEFGLISMRTRAERLGGRVVVDSQPGRGTRILARVPIPRGVVPSAAA